MKNQHEAVRVLMLIPLLLVFAAGAYAQSAKDPRQDLSVSFSSKHKGEGHPGFIFGMVSNNSAEAYPCVRIEFDMYTRFDMVRAGHDRRHLGVLPVEIKNLQPREGRAYERPLPGPAGIGLKSVVECSALPVKELPDGPEILSFTIEPQRITAGQAATLKWRTTNAEHVFVGERNPEWPHASPEPVRAPRAIGPSGSLPVSPSQTATYRLEAKKQGKSSLKDVTVEVEFFKLAETCSITGQLRGKLHYDVTDDRGQPASYDLTHMSMKRPGPTELIYTPVQKGGGGDEHNFYSFTSVPAGHTYTISPGGFFSEPREVEVSCSPNATLRDVDFTITGPPSG